MIEPLDVTVCKPSNSGKAFSSSPRACTQTVLAMSNRSIVCADMAESNVAEGDVAEGEHYPVPPSKWY